MAVIIIKSVLTILARAMAIWHWTCQPLTLVNRLPPNSTKTSFKNKKSLQQMNLML